MGIGIQKCIKAACEICNRQLILGLPLLLKLTAVIPTRRKAKGLSCFFRLVSLSSDSVLKGNGLRWRGISDKVTGLQWNPKNQGKVLQAFFLSNCTCKMLFLKRSVLLLGSIACE